MLCKTLNAFQRQSLRLFAVSLLILAGMTLLTSRVFGAPTRAHSSSAMTYAVLLFSVLPMIAIMLVIGRYLAGENDEFVRSLVIRSLLWGFGAAMIADTALGFVLQLFPASSHLATALGVLNMDIFVVTSGFALRVQMWSNG